MLVNDPSAHQPATTTQLQTYESARIESSRQQIAKSEAREIDTTRSISEAALQKRKEREEKRRLAAASKAQAAGNEGEIFASESKEGSSFSNTKAEKHSSASLNDKHAYMITIPTSSSSFDWYDTVANVYSTITAAKSAGIWSYPSSSYERARCGVFKALWEQGFYMGIGIKFGGDFLVYPGSWHGH